MHNDGLLLVNLGSPSSTSTADVRAYLSEFLHDPYVIDYPPPIRRLIVDGIILRTRPRRSAAAYASIWWPDGSPLVELSQRLANKVRQRVAMPVALAMRYGEPSITAGIAELVRAGTRRIVLMPMYPQYAMSSTLTVIESVKAVLSVMYPMINLVVVPSFHADPDYLSAMAGLIRNAVMDVPDHVIFSYHGLPERHLRKTDPTRSHCLKTSDCCDVSSTAHATCYRHQSTRTTADLVELCGLDATKVTMTFQSRLGIDRWLRPYTMPTVLELAQRGIQHIAIVCPAFVTDCLETLEEIGHGVQQAFIAAGGKRVTLIPCLNDTDAWADALVRIVGRTQRGTTERRRDGETEMMRYD